MQMKGLRIGSVCSGIGGLDLAIEKLGIGEIKWQVEIDPFCQRILAKHWPKTKKYWDLKKLTSSLQAYPVPPTQLPENAEEKMMTEISGLNYSQPFAMLDHDTSSWKTCQPSLETNTSPQFSGKWPKQGGIASSGVAFQRQKSEHLTREKGFSSWPTASARDWKGGTHTTVMKNGRYIRRSNKTGTEYGASLDGAVGNWPTPDTQNVRDGAKRRKAAYGNHAVSLHHKVDAWPTPTTAEAGKIGNRANKGQKGLSNHPSIVGETFRPAMNKSRAGDGLSTQPLSGPQAPQIQKDGRMSSSDGPTSLPQLLIASTDNGDGERRKLNPMFVEWLMGLPEGWTETPD